MSKEYYLHNYIFIRQALSRAAMVAVSPSDPNLEIQEMADALTEFREMIACEFHMAQAYFYKDNFSRAIFFAECAKNDNLQLPGMTAYNPQMLPFYQLLVTCYAWYAKKNQTSNHSSLYNSHALLARKYKGLIESIKSEHELGDEAEHEVLFPAMPDLNDPKLGVPYTATEEEQHDDTYNLRFDLECELFENCKLHAHIFFEDSWLTKEHEDVIANLHLAYAKQLFTIGDYKAAFFHIMRAHSIKLQLLGHDYFDPSLLGLYKTLVHFCSTMQGFAAIDEDHFFAREAAFYQERLDGVHDRIAQNEKDANYYYTTSASTTPTVRCSPNSL